MIERKSHIDKWHWKVVAKFYRYKYKILILDRMDWLRRNTKAYDCLLLIANSGNWTNKMIVDMANQGLGRSQ